MLFSVCLSAPLAIKNALYSIATVHQPSKGDRWLQDRDPAAARRAEQAARSDQVFGEGHLRAEEGDPGTRRDNSGQGTVL